MPRQFNAHPKHPAVEYLVRLHADIGGQMQANKTEADRLAEAAKHIEAVIRLFDPVFNARAISARRRQKTNPWFRRGTLFRAAMDVLRKATAPMTVRELTDAVMAAKGITDATVEQRKGIEGGLRSSLEGHAGKGLERVGDGVPRRWRLMG